MCTADFNPVTFVLGPERDIVERVNAVDLGDTEFALGQRGKSPRRTTSADPDREKREIAHRNALPAAADRWSAAGSGCQSMDPRSEVTLG